MCGGLLVTPTTSLPVFLPESRVPPDAAASTSLPAPEVAVNCPSPKCGSSNVQLLSHYVDSLPPGSSLRSEYARPAMPEGGFLGALAAAVVGIAMLLSGGGLAGVVVLAGGFGWGYVMWRRHETADGVRAAWASRRICLACTEQWVP